MIASTKWTSRAALLSDGTTVPITNLLDEFGDETDDPDEAVTFVAGDGDQWFTGLCSDYDEVTIQ
ncbi:hypothetical protein [Phenylobacterium sp.]|uniref:hypothetical protein n=1 Tax=Phenylobacterium sp. TaxID=1871053 RepID=UPI00286E6913|nr:hypothetical protein [Phenylobacterium sp.]